MASTNEDNACIVRIYDENEGDAVVTEFVEPSIGSKFLVCIITYYLMRLYKKRLRIDDFLA